MHHKPPKQWKALHIRQAPTWNCSQLMPYLEISKSPPTERQFWTSTPQILAPKLNRKSRSRSISSVLESFKTLSMLKRIRLINWALMCFWTACKSRGWTKLENERTDQRCSTWRATSWTNPSCVMSASTRPRSWTFPTRWAALDPKFLCEASVSRSLDPPKTPGTKLLLFQARQSSQGQASWAVPIIIWRRSLTLKERSLPSMPVAAKSPKACNLQGPENDRSN